MFERHRRAVRGHVHIARIAAALLTAAIASAGCGAGEPADTSGKVEVAALGDSITAGNPAFDPDPAQRAALGFGDNERSQFEYWAEQADERLSVRNCGVFGERADEIAERLDDCVGDGADVLIVQGGINDVAQGRPIADAADDLQSMVERGKRLGLVVLLVEVLPWNNGHPFADRPITELNGLIATIGENERVPVIGFHDALASASDPQLMASSLTADGDHPSIEGYRRLGELVALELGRALPE